MSHYDKTDVGLLTLTFSITSQVVALGTLIAFSSIVTYRAMFGTFWNKTNHTLLYFTIDCIGNCIIIHCKILIENKHDLQKEIRR